MADFEPQYFDFDAADSFIDSISGTLNPDRIPPSALELPCLDQQPPPFDGYQYGLPAFEYSEATQDGSNSGFEVSPMSHQELLSSANTSPGGPSVKQEFSPPQQLESPEEPRPQPPKKTAAKVTKPKKDKSSHNMIEKKYRTNINSKIVALRDAVPALRIAAGSKDVTVADLEGLTPASKLNKASVLTKATEYIKHLETKNQILQQQNQQLQNLIAQANLRGPPVPIQAPQAPPQGLGFGFYPEQQSYNAAPIAEPTPGPQHAPIYDPQVPQYSFSGNKMLMAGMATVVGQQLFAGDSKFQGMSSFAMFYGTGVSSATRLLALAQVALFAGALYAVISPWLKREKGDKEKNDAKSAENSDWELAKTWCAVQLGVRLPVALSSAKVEEISAVLLGRSTLPPADVYRYLVRAYFLLSVSETSFDSCLLGLIIGSMVAHRFPKIAPAFKTSLSYKAQLILHLDYRGSNPHVAQLAELIHNIDGLSLLGSHQLLTYLHNMATRTPLNEGSRGRNAVVYVDLYQEQCRDFYGVLAAWRVFELLDQLTLSYLEAVVADDDDELKVIMGDIATVGKVVQPQSKLAGYYQLVQAVINWNDAPKLLESTQGKVSACLSKFALAVDGAELTDDENDGWSDDEHELAPVAKRAPKPSKSLITQLGLVTPEQFVVLVASMVVYHIKNREFEHAIKLLGYLRLNAEHMTLLSFTAVLNMLNNVVSPLYDVEVVDDAVKVTREWLNNAGLDSRLSQKLGKLIVAKGMVICGVEVESDNE
ncbi:transcription factor Cph2p [Diutina catenulata]